MMVALTLVSPHSTCSFSQLHTKSQPAPLQFYLSPANETITCRPFRSFGRRFVTRSVPSGLRIRSAATKPAKSPGTDHLSTLALDSNLDDCVVCTTKLMTLFYNKF